MIENVTRIFDTSGLIPENYFEDTKIYDISHIQNKLNFNSKENIIKSIDLIKDHVNTIMLLTEDIKSRRFELGVYPDFPLVYKVKIAFMNLTDLQLENIEEIKQKCHVQDKNCNILNVIYDIKKYNITHEMAFGTRTEEKEEIKFKECYFYDN